ncbi:hypothetical protein LTR70_000184 [Exophiala xenobiotica]|uniref:Uncharacterized protein n=1 Tax=Lithohypha guttulata TaxID=1690604 RepID=A0ABR0KPC5_9EURO|nr:hypothetical protein LTR24_000309 [Lithohypha guttulata]KAK5330862.1 hypothetical protein LTR70_000184 [Exophiala xenobiotica]
MSAASNSTAVTGASVQPRTGSRMMEHFMLESAHRAPYVAGTVTPQRRGRAVIAAVDKVLTAFDGDKSPSK